MLSAILSDTLLLKSPTTTDMDREVASNLASIAHVSIESYGMAMLKAGSSIQGMSYKEIVEQDYKTYKIDDYNIGIGQVMTLDIDSIMSNKEEYINILNNQHDNYNYKVSLLFVTDVIKNGSYLFYNESSSDVVSTVYNIKDIKEGVFLSEIVSRKKQMLPDLMDYLQK